MTQITRGRLMWQVTPLTAYRIEERDIMGVSLISRRYVLVAAGVFATLPARLPAQQCEGLQPGRASLIVSTTVVGQVALVALRSPGWWPKPDTSFHFVWDGSSSGGQNHLLHANLAYQFSLNTQMAWDWACASPGAAAWLGAAMGFFFIIPKEIGDAYRRTNSGFSGLSLMSSALGASLPALHRTLKPSRALVPKVNYFPSPEIRNGSVPAPMIERDYAGQRYFLAINPGLAMPGPGGWPDWLGVAIGHSVAAAYTGVVVPQFFFTLDLNLRGLPVQADWWNSAAGFLDRFHLPLPGVRLQDGVMQFGLY